MSASNASPCLLLLLQSEQADVTKLHEHGEAELRRLYKEVFGENSDAKLESRVDDYQNALAEHTFPNGGRLRDYQAEGVSWLMANYVNKRSSILADEMGEYLTRNFCCWELQRFHPVRAQLFPLHAFSL